MFKAVLAVAKRSGQALGQNSRRRIHPHHDRTKNLSKYPETDQDRTVEVASRAVLAAYEFNNNMLITGRDKKRLFYSSSSLHTEKEKSTMNRMAQVALLLCLAGGVAGCSTTATVGTIQTSNTYANKIPLKAVVYIPDELQNRIVIADPSTTLCSAWKAELTAGQAYRSAVENGLAAALESVQVVNVPPTPETAQQQNADLLVTVALSNENANITVNEKFLSSAINTQFQASMLLTIADRNGQNLYTYTANGAGFGNQSGSCSDIAPALKTSMETAMKQIADNIAQSTFGSAQIKEYETKKE